jgi:zinc/manganese transport system substrate-binding protein
LRELDDWTRKRIGTVPADRHKIITGHDAFGYMGTTYASTAELAAPIDQIKHKRIEEIFIENSNDPRLLESIAAATVGVKNGSPVASS